jgi:hypothetical protein
MSFVGMYFVGGVFNLVFLTLSIIGYYYIARKTGNKFTFWLLFASAWLVSCISYIFLIFGIPSGVWYITLIRIVTYLLFLATIISMFLELVRFKK